MHLSGRTAEFTSYIPISLQMEEKLCEESHKKLEADDWKKSLPEVVANIHALIQRKNALHDALFDACFELEASIGCLLNFIEEKQGSKSKFKAWRKAVFPEYNPQSLDRVQRYIY